MNAKEIMEIFRDTAYVRMGGSPEERKTAEYLMEKVSQLGLEAQLQEFQVPMSDIQEAQLLADGKAIPCKGYLCAGNADVEAPLYYLRNLDEYSLRQCRGKIVMIDGYMRYWTYHDLFDNGAVGFITYDGNVNFADRDIDQRELRSYVSQGKIIPGVNINAKDAVALVEQDVKTVRLTLKQEETTGPSWNVLLTLPGEIPEYITFTAHYDSTSLSQGAYDNMSGCIGLLSMAEYFSKNPHRYGLRFLWCGSEERGLLGSKDYCSREENLSDCVLNINLDMIGCTMGKFIAVATAEEKACNYLSYLALEQGISLETSQGVYSSDSTPFADKGVPAITFARSAPPNTASYHNSYDTMAVMKGDQMVEDIAFITTFADRMANAVLCPVKREIPNDMKEKLDIYLCRKRK